MTNADREEQDRQRRAEILDRLLKQQTEEWLADPAHGVIREQANFVSKNKRLGVKKTRKQK
jgi:hypothetical protein